MKRTVPSPRSYIGTFIGLMVLLGITIVAGYMDFGELNLPIAMTISIAKTLLIILFFMHVWRGSRLTWIFAGAGFFWLMFLLALAMADYATRHWSPVVPF
jgi:cytochrome c oxidase subunit 4